MSDRYYYLLAQLPGLYFGREPELSLPAFLAEARKWLSRKAMTMVHQTDLFDISDEPGGCKLLKRLKSFERSFRTELGAWRRARLDGGDLRTSFPPGLVREGNPLEIERRLLRFRWDRLEEEEQGHHFDLEAVLIYHLKLQILIRLAVFDTRRGLETYRDLTGRTSLQT